MNTTHTDHPLPVADRNRLRWRSRRGLLELDLVLQRFLESEFDQLTLGELDCFEELLTAADNDLLDWVDGRLDPADPNLMPMLLRLRSCAQAAAPGAGLTRAGQP